MKKVSVLVPCYNTKDTIERCATSLLNQTIGKENMEIFLIDDCSTDDTYEELKRWEAMYPGIIFAVRTPQNCQCGGARNYATPMTTGRYIGYCDADDWAEPLMYEHMYEAAEKYGCDAVCCRYTKDREYKLNDDVRYDPTKEDRVIDIKTDEVRSELIALNYIDFGVWNHLYSRDLIVGKNVYAPDGKAYEDVFFTTQIYMYMQKLYMIEEQLYHYYVNDTSIVRSMDRPHHEDFFEVGRMRYKLIEDIGGFERCGEAFRFDILLTYYLSGLKLLSLRYSNPPYARFLELVENTRRWTGDTYRTSEYVSRMCTDFQKVQLSLLDKDLSEEEFRSVCEITRKYFSEGQNV
ncbi:MAG: glycosyltransferase [Eubacterium sp.]|nr:glycosyltransferase [Eubacterium sp.]